MRSDREVTDGGRDGARRVPERYRTLIANAIDGVWIVSPDGVVLDVNARAEEIHGRTRGALIGRRFAEHLPPEHAGDEREQLARVAREGFIHADGVTVHRPDGAQRHVEISACLVPCGGDDVILVLERDVTPRMRLEEQVRQAQKMEAVGSLAGGIAHDFNNVLAAVMLGGEMLVRSLAPADPRRVDALDLIDAAERGAALTRQLLGFSRREARQPEHLNLNAVVGGVEKMLRRLLGEDVDLRFDWAPELGGVHADVGQLEQVIVNLAVNARDAMPQGGCLTIATDDLDVDAGFAASHLGLEPGPYVVLSIADTGAGMDASTQERIFEPFFTTKPRGQGTGLGLSTCYGIVAQHGGRISVYSEPGRGSVFRVYLPRVGSSPIEVERARAAAAATAGTETILVIEDDARVRVAVERVLVEHGYRVLLAGDQREALAAVDSSCAIDLVVSDMVVPDATGPQIVERIRARLPGTRVLYMSGYAERRTLDGEPITDEPILQKPFAVDALARKVRETLDR